MSEPGEQTQTPPGDENLPARSEGRELEKLEPYQQKIERFADVYYEGCRRVAGLITSLKDQFED